jgi:hypothetical protein
MDPTDLLCLPAVLVSLWWMKRARRVSSSRLLEGAAILAAALASLATSAPRPPREPMPPREPQGEACAGAQGGRLRDA